MKTPIVMAAFGTTSRALETYSLIDEKLKKSFPDHEILWSYSSRMVKDWIKKRKGIELKHPHQVLVELKEKGYPWAVVQSLHLMCGHEFYRLVEEVKGCGIRTSVGLPLLCDLGDYQEVIAALASAHPSFNQNNSAFSNPQFEISDDEAVVMVGHGTDHPSWSSFLALHHMFRERFGSGIYVGVVEDGYPSMEEIVESVKKSGFKKVRLIPFMMVAGVHFEEDLIGDEDSWKTAFEQEGISVSFEAKGLGLNHGIIEIFCRHIKEALDVIPKKQD